jgi:hypothetical protein
LVIQNPSSAAVGLVPNGATIITGKTPHTLHPDLKATALVKPGALGAAIK